MLILLTSCNNPDTDEDLNRWVPIIKDLELVLVADIPDSSKSARIDEIFQQHQIDLADYEEFFRKGIEEKQLTHITLLKEIETVLGTEMKDELNRQRQQAEQENKPRTSK
jgi:hypothetical protein